MYAEITENKYPTQFQANCDEPRPPPCSQAFPQPSMVLLPQERPRSWPSASPAGDKERSLSSSIQSGEVRKD